MSSSRAACLAGVIGWPIAHSLSPHLHGHWLQRHAIAGAYVALPVHPDDLELAFRALPRLGFAGWNVTLPHKEAAWLLVAAHTAAAARMKVVNTVMVRPDGTLLGHNSDGHGFLASLDQQAPGWRARLGLPGEHRVRPPSDMTAASCRVPDIDEAADPSPASGAPASGAPASGASASDAPASDALAGPPPADSTTARPLTGSFGPGATYRASLGQAARPAAMLLGTGGAARAVAVGLLDAGVADLRLVNRTLDKAQGLAAELTLLAPQAHVTAWPWDARVAAQDGALLLVQCTSLGMTGKPALDLDLAGLPQDAIVADLVYVPLATELLLAARARGHVTVDGLGMLLHQAVPGFAHWGGLTPSVDAEARAALLTVLAGRQ